MASCSSDAQAGRARLSFRLDGRQDNRALLARSAREAERACALREKVISDLKRVKLALPQGADAADTLLWGGQVVKRQEAKADRLVHARLSELRSAYQECPPPHLKRSTRTMQELPFRRLMERFSEADLCKLDSLPGAGEVLPDPGGERVQFG